MDDTDDRSVLVSEFCPPLDPTVVYAIYSDFAGNGNALQQTREILAQFTETAAFEQDSGFDPSGSAGGAHEGDGQRSDGSSPSESDITSVSNGLSSLTFSHGSGPGSTSASEGPSPGTYYAAEVEDGDMATKELRLVETFPTLKPTFIQYVLQKCNGSLDTATDELLNHVYFEDAAEEGQEKVVTKGVDAFYADDDAAIGGRGRRGKKGKAKKQKKLAAAGATMEMETAMERGHGQPGLELEMTQAAPSPVRNQWQAGSEEVTKLAGWLKMPVRSVRSLYMANGASVERTVMAILHADAREAASPGSSSASDRPDRPDLEVDATDLVHDFPWLPFDLALALVRRTDPSASTAREVARYVAASRRRSSGPSPAGSLQVIPRYAPLRLNESSSSSSADPPPSPRSSRSDISPVVPPTTTAYRAARHHAFSQASTAWRRGRSDHLMRAAAGYYGQLGRDYDAALRAAAADEADALVARQSSPTQLDLHGVAVKEAVRIARERVTAWWAGLGEDRIRTGARTGHAYRIITGMGRHSESGVSKLGPAVSKALMRDGWRVEIGSGTLVVTGVARKR